MNFKAILIRAIVEVELEKRVDEGRLTMEEYLRKTAHLASMTDKEVVETFKKGK